MADPTRPEQTIGQDKETQEMVQKAEEDYPNLELNEALQKEANQQAGREAQVGEGSTGGGVIESIKETATEAVDTLKQMNPATRDMREKHC